MDEDEDDEELEPSGMEEGEEPSEEREHDSSSEGDEDDDDKYDPAEDIEPAVRLRMPFLGTLQHFGCGAPKRL